MKSIIEQIVKESIEVKDAFFASHASDIETCAQKMTRALKNNKKILLFGNGGSAADCQHIAAEFINRFQMERHPLPAIALTTDTSVITSIGNDYAFEDIFKKQVQALGMEGDVAIGISTSGNSPNVVKAIDEANQMNLMTIGFSGRSGRLETICDQAFCVNSKITARIQEVHILLAHILCDLTERMLFSE